MSGWLSRREETIHRYRRLSSSTGTLVTNAAGTVIVMHGHFPAFEGSGTASPYATLGLCTAGGGRARKYGPGFTVDDEWVPGKIGLALPDQPATGCAPAMSMLGIAFNIDDLPACHGAPISRDSLLPVANRLFNDPLAAWIMTSLWNDADAHGASSAFFDHGLSLLLHRLATLAESDAVEAGPRGDGRLAGALAMIEQRLDEDLRVGDLAPLTGLDPRSFTRAFKRETGHTPFAWLTRRRMERARTLLREGSSVTEVAGAVGYANPAKFSAAFRRWVGCAPSEWLRKRG